MKSELLKQRTRPLAFDDLVCGFWVDRGACETELARAILFDPAHGIAAARAESVDASWFVTFYDMRCVYVACDLAHDRGRDFVLRMCRALVEAEGEFRGLRGFDQFAKSSASCCSSPFMQYIGVRQTARALARMIAAERDATEHLRAARRLLEAQVAA